MQDFPSMFNWFGKDIVRSEHARTLMASIASEISTVDAITPHPAAREATRYLNDLGVPALMQGLLGVRWPSDELKLVAARDIFNQCYVYPNTVICRTDPTCAEYVAMLAHEGGHILTLDVVNDSELTEKDCQLAWDMAEALAQAIQICITDRCGVR
jgi:hypothetical protein